MTIFRQPWLWAIAMTIGTRIGGGLGLSPAIAVTYSYPAGDTLSSEFKDRLAPGDTILVPPGTRYVTNSLISGLTIRGDGPADSIVFSPYIPSAAMFAFGPGASPTRIENLTFDAHLTPEATALYFAGCQIEVKGNRFYGGYGVKADSSKGVIADNRFDQVMSALRCSRSEIWVDRNVIDGARNGAISMRGSPLRITRNRIVRNENTGIVITGKRYVPVIGGEPGMGNEISGGFNSDLYTDSGKPINAQYNYWGIKTTEEMNRLGFPANISAFTDKWDLSKAAGEIDYRNWLDGADGNPAKPTGAAAVRGVAGKVAVGAALLLIMGFLATRIFRRGR